MILSKVLNERKLNHNALKADLVVIGGGIAGTCCAITAARKGLNVILAQDRPVLGGNSSSEVRLWILGATSHMGNNNRWAREGGIINEILIENTYRNPEGNPVIFDAILLEKVTDEDNITLLLNCAVYEVAKEAGSIQYVTAFCSQNSTQYKLYAPLFCDASGDGIAGYLAGAEFRMGAESKEEFEEKFAPSKEYGELLGHSIYFYSKDVGKPINYVPPRFALQDITQIPKFRSFNTEEYGCRLWWIEYGGELDTVHDTETIKWELWKVIYGVWDYIKNSGKFPESKNLTLEWVGTIPGKRESRRFIGDYILNQKDIVEQRQFNDAVSFGGWAVDLHPAEGVFSEKPGCNQYHSKGVYEIPYRTMYSKNVDNLFLAGRLISATHVAFGSTRVMGTCGHNAQAVAMAAVLCKKYGINPRQVNEGALMHELQMELLRMGQFIPNKIYTYNENLSYSATLESRKGSTFKTQGTIVKGVHFDEDVWEYGESTLKLDKLEFNGGWLPLKCPTAQMLPHMGGIVPNFRVFINADQPTVLQFELRISSKEKNHTPDRILSKILVKVKKGEQFIDVNFKTQVPSTQYLFFCISANNKVSIQQSNTRITGLLSVFNKENLAVGNTGKQSFKEDLGFDSFEFWVPERRPEGKNIAMFIDPPIESFQLFNLLNGINRPTGMPNAWVADLLDHQPTLILKWPRKQAIGRIVLTFDCDYDHPMESSLMGHPENVMPFVVRDYTIFDDNDKVLYEMSGNYQAINSINFSTTVSTAELKFAFKRPSQHIPVALFEIQCYE